MDLLDKWEELPEEVQGCIDSVNRMMDKGNYIGKQVYLDELSSLGYTFEEDMSGTIFNLQKL